MKKVLATTVLIAGLITVSNAAFAGADCQAYPEEERMAPSSLLLQLEERGYQIKTFKVDDNCYEIYGLNSDGKKAEIYFDMKTGEVVKSEVDD